MNLPTLKYLALINLIHRIATVLAVTTFVLVVWGGHVNTTRSGMAFADWPTSNGAAMMTYTPSEWFLQGEKFWEHGHRLLATVVGMITTLLLIVVFKATPKKLRPSRSIIVLLSLVLVVVATGIIGLHSMPAGFLEAFMFMLAVLLASSVFMAVRKKHMVRMLWLAISGFISVCLQGMFGGYTVLNNLPDWTSTTHGMLAEVFFMIVIAIAITSSRSWSTQPKHANLDQRGRTLILFTWAAVMVQFLLGALTRHTDAWGVSITFPMWSDESWFPSAQLLQSLQVAVHFMHRVVAFIVAIAVFFSWNAIRRTDGRSSRIFKMASIQLAMIFAQIGLGAWLLFSFRGELQTTLHVLGGVMIVGIATSMLIYASKGSPTTDSVELSQNLSLGKGRV